MRFYCNPVPVLTVTSIALDSTGNTATLTTSQPLPKSGCFNLRFAGACCLGFGMPAGHPEHAAAPAAKA